MKILLENIFFLQKSHSNILVNFRAARDREMKVRTLEEAARQAGGR